MEDFSLSKGVFAYKGKYKIGKKKKKEVIHPEYLKAPWYIAFDETCQYIDEVVENVTSKMFQQIMSDLMSFVRATKSNSLNISSQEIATAILLTGVNVPDHCILFDTIVSSLSKITSHIAMVWSRECNNLKTIIQETVYQLVYNSNDDCKIRKSQCTMRVLKEYFEENHDLEDPLIIILPDFESFITDVLHDFILVLSSYRSTLKFVLIFGVATTLHAVHKSLTYYVTSKLVVQVFHTQTQVKTLSDVLESTVFTSTIPFKLIGRAFQLLTDIFLFYDFSVDIFLQNYKLCMIQHFYDNNISSLCCQPKDIKKRISKLTEENIADIKNLPSIVKYLKSSSEISNGDEEHSDKKSDKKFTELLEKLLNDFHKFMDRFLIILRCLHCLSATLPGSPMGKQLREIYTKVVYINNLTESSEYKECLKLLGFLSKEELLSKLNSVIEIIKKSKDPVIEKIKNDLDTYIEMIQEASLSTTSSEIVSLEKKLSRIQLKEKLLQMSQQQSRTAYKQAQIDLINYLDQKVFSVHLINPNRVPAYEIFCYSDGTQAKQHIRGSLRACVHMGLSDPQMYLDCACCKLENEDDILCTLPDLSIIYKLHKESGKQINMYDWLQAFLTIVDPRSQSKQNKDDIDPVMRYRFFEAVTSLVFLGFIKVSQRKPDHVKRLT
ncbi:origin recognition complex subunit 3 [Pogonomyrmex barbatus]|uniref:Origin recognition complex subunit 3 n=1 Tax=Pogonomyrmex barbatus TaxID=144034 RepID=A0A6I9WP51_9HYME|nr:origin recognition complex subunit 3 [Pogonomyrmex barbatus]